MKLRHYQEKGVSSVKKEFAKGHKAVIMCAPTGSGKTVMFADITTKAVLKGSRVLIFTDRKELNAQAASKLQGAVRFTANTKIFPKSSVVIAMIETFKRRMQKKGYIEYIQSFDLIIIDEAHKATFDSMFKYFTEKQRIIGATATPLRTGKQKPLSEFYQSIVDIVSIRELIAKGFLAKPNYFGVKQDLSNIGTRGNDYAEEQLSRYYNKQELYEGVVHNYKLRAEGKKTLVFSASVQNSLRLRDEFIRAGYAAEHLDGNTRKIERERILRDFKKGNVKVLCNVGVLTTGYDEPSIEAIILYRATKSLILYLQMVGRGSRVISGIKESFTILDFGNNIDPQHGFWHEERNWTLHKKRRNTKKTEERPIKSCEKCGALIPANARKCTYCGYVFPVKKKTKKFAVLKELHYDEIKARVKNTSDVSEMEDIREARGYKIGWLLHQFESLEQFKEYGKHKGYDPKWAYIQAKRYNLR